MIFKLVPTALFVLLLTNCTPSKQLGKNGLATNSAIDSAPSSNNSQKIDSTEDPTDTRVVRLGANVNTEFSEFAPFKYGNRFYFTSSKAAQPNGAPANHIYSLVGDGSAAPWSENSKDADLQTSNITFTADGQRVFFNFCETSKTGEQRCEIYSRERAFEGYWLPYKRLPKFINLEGFTANQPSIGFNRAMRQEVLYFSSNRPGGMGGMDIWCCPIERNGTYGKPFPLPINTPADEVTPFFHQQNQVLYFSSNVAGDATGFDIYKSANTWSGAGKSHWSVPEKLEKPFNSRYNDLYFTWHTGSGTAYFASDRPGCFGVDSTGCIGFDIFEAQIQTEMVAQVFDSSDSTAIVGYKLQIYPISDANVAGLPGAVDGAEMKFLLETDKSYRLIASAIGYLPDTLEFNASQSDVFEKLRQPIFLKPKARLLVRTYNAIDSLPLGGVTLQLGLEGVGEKTSVSNAEDEFEYAFLVGVGDLISLVAMKPGFTTTYVQPNAQYRFAPTSDAHLSVYMSPFTEAPVALYFDNDEPKWVKQTDATTKLTYAETLQKYLEREQVFVKNFSEGLNADEAEQAGQMMHSFFEEEVQPNLARLDRLCQQLDNYLKKGYALEMLTVGEASPLASEEYNNLLISRRISSVVNQLKTWNNGELNQYFENGQLIVSSSIKVMPGQGEKVQVKLSDRRQSEFSPEASKMRRVLIQGVKRQKSKA